VNKTKTLPIADDLHTALKIAAAKRNVGLQELGNSILRAALMSEQKLKKRKANA
jgi:plasmid stability protein